MYRSIRRVAIVGLASLVVSGFVAVAGVAPADAAPSSTYPKGVDVSEWQSHYQGNPDVNWTKLKSSGVSFALIKASGGYKVTNDAFVDQWNGAADAGIIRGAYHLAAPNLPSSNLTSNAITQADYFASKASQTPQGALWSAGGNTLPPVLDMEKDQQQGTPNGCYNMTPAQLRSWISSYVKEVTAKVGRAPIIYTPGDFWDECIGNSTMSFAGSALWKASYDPTVGTIPASWATWTLWQWHEGANVPSAGNTDYDKDVFNGTMTSLRLLADPTYQFTNTPTTRLHDYNGDGKTDILAITSTGTLYDYRGNGDGGFLSPANVAVGTGMNSYNAFAAVGKATSSGNPGLYARGSSGSLYYFPVSPKGSLGTRVTVASGWSGMSKIASAGDFNGDGYADITAVDKVGVLWLYLGDKTGKFSGRVQLASGWNSKTMVIGGSDFNGDGYSDLLARDSSGGLALYTHVPTVAGLVKTTVPQTGWNNYTKIFTPGDFTGVGKNADLMAIGKSGQMYVFAGTGDSANPFPVRKAVGTTTSWGSRAFLG